MPGWTGWPGVFKIWGIVVCIMLVFLFAWDVSTILFRHAAFSLGSLHILRNILLAVGMTTYSTIMIATVNKFLKRW